MINNEGPRQTHGRCDTNKHIYAQMGSHSQSGWVTFIKAKQNAISIGIILRPEPDKNAFNPYPLI